MPDPTRCAICNRPLDQPSDPLSESCGGDCLDCMIGIEDGEDVPGLPPDLLRTWLDMHSDVAHHLVDAYLADRPVAADRAEIKRVVLDDWRGRLLALNFPEEATQAFVNELVDRVQQQPKDRPSPALRLGQMVVVDELPPDLLPGLPPDDQAAIHSVVGRPVRFAGYSLGHAELEFVYAGDIHTIWVLPSYLKCSP